MSTKSLLAAGDLADLTYVGPKGKTIMFWLELTLGTERLGKNGQE